MQVSSQKALQDFINGFVNWRIIYILGISEIKKRYSRSKIGQLWLTLSLSIHIATIGLVWSYLFKLPLKEYLPYVAISIIFWNYISISITESTTLYTSHNIYLMELNISKITYINSLLFKNIIVIGHNILVLIPIYVVFNIPLSLTGLILSIIGFILLSIFLFAILIFTSLISLRYRDFTNIITSLLQVIFYFTPIMWRIEFIPERFSHYMVLNPFTVFLSICRDPLLSINIPIEYWVAAVIYIFLTLLIAIPIFIRYRARIVYWL